MGSLTSAKTIWSLIYWDNDGKKIRLSAKGKEKAIK